MLNLLGLLLERQLVRAAAQHGRVALARRKRFPTNHLPVHPLGACSESLGEDFLLPLRVVECALDRDDPWVVQRKLAAAERREAREELLPLRRKGERGAGREGSKQMSKERGQGR